MRRIFLTLAFLSSFFWGASQTTVVDVVVDSEDHNTLEAAVVAAGLTETLSGEGPFTVFAPTDSAFAALPEGLVETLLADPTGDLTDILLYHVLSGQVLSTDLMDGMTATTLNGKDITVTINDEGVFINDAQVTVADITTDNGVVHVIDAVLIPPTVTVVDVIVNSEDHNTLEAAVVAAGLAETLSGEGPFTVFAPTDAAFAALPEGLVEALLADPTGDLTDILLYHVLSGQVLSTDLMDGMTATTLNGKDITVTINDEGVFINDAQVTVADITTDNGVVHVIDAVLIPPTVTVVDVIVNSEDHNTLEAAVVAAGLAETLSGEGPFTVFAPTDAAFAALPEGLVETLLADPTGDLTDILLYHVLSGQVTSTDLMDGMTATTLNGKDITVTINDEGVFINDAQVTVADITTDNGVVHVIDAVLIPPTMTVVDVIINSEDHNTLEAAVVAAGLAETLSGEGPFTVFAPTDAAFAALPEGLVETLLADPTGDLTDILLYHVLSGQVLSTDLMDGMTATTLNGKDITVTINDEGVFINDAQVTVADIETDNGVVHVIDAVLIPVDGGEIMITGGGTETSVCSGDGADDLVDVTLTGALGLSTAWVITDDQGKILDLPAGPPFNFEGAGSGVCLIWHLSWTGDLVGAEIDANAADLQGNFDLSNPITVTRNQIEGDVMITTTEGLTEKTICTNDENQDFVDVILTGADAASGSWVITDANGIILDLPDAPPFFLDGIEEETCLIWFLSAGSEVEGVEIGANAVDLTGCFGLSNPITVTKDPSADCPETCLPPATSTVSALSPTSVFIDWPAVTEAYIYVVRYRPVGTDTWKFASVYRSRREIKNLQPGTTYEYQIQTLCLPEESPLGPLSEFSTPTLAIAPAVTLRNQADFSMDKQASMDILPNPVISTLRLNYTLGAETGRLTITHISGRKVFETRLNAREDFREIDMSNVPDGYYLITLNNGTDILTEKFVKASY